MVFNNVIVREDSAFYLSMRFWFGKNLFFGSKTVDNVSTCLKEYLKAEERTHWKNVLEESERVLEEGRKVLNKGEKVLEGSLGSVETQEQEKRHNFESRKWRRRGVKYAIETK